MRASSTAEEPPKQPIILFSTADERFFPGLLVAICSAIECASGNYPYDVKILNGGIREEQWSVLTAKVQQIAAKKGIKVEMTCRDLSASELSILPTRRGSPLTNARLLVPSLYPELESAVYLDSDVLCFRGIEEFHESLDPNHALSACVDPLKCIRMDKSVRVHHDRKAWGKAYFNAGIIGMNIQQWREKLAAISLLLKSDDEFKYADQSLLNRLFVDQWNEVNPLANHVLTLRNCGSYDPIHSPANLHFVGPKKPWLTFESNFQRLYFDQLFDRKLVEFGLMEPAAKRTSSKASLKKALRKRLLYRLFNPPRGRVYARAIELHDQAAAAMDRV